LENLVMVANAFQNKRVWLSGHTGFKGAWLTQWLLDLGAEVTGYALAPATTPALFNQLTPGPRLDHQIADIRDAAAVKQSIHATQPDFVFHLAAQAILRASYDSPVDTYATNVMGTINVLEAVRELKKPCAVVIVTTDKCYENREWVHGYREEDPLGGYDPYSSSKAAAEIATSAWRRSFFTNHPVRIATARAGNVIGGGDWAKDRIVPDCIRALQQGQPIGVRNPHATRPWQHVLEPLSGYLWLGAALANPALAKCPPATVASAFNFGPTHESNRNVGELVETVLKHWPGRWLNQSEPNAVHEAKLLQLTTDKAHALLQWAPAWNFHQAVEQTIKWYQAAQNPAAVPEFTRAQIQQYQAAAQALQIPWALPAGKS
jgi:CDP-glucose 4,6-dehydratase